MATTPQFLSKKKAPKNGARNKTRNHEKRRNFFVFSAEDVVEIVMCEKALMDEERIGMHILIERSVASSLQ